MPTLVANHIPPGMDVILQSENGMLGIGPYPLEARRSTDLINAGKETVSEMPGTAYFSSADSFAMIRGGHVDLTVLGAIQVDEQGNLANWMIPGKMLKGMGGAMDLVAGARRVIIAMEHAHERASAENREKVHVAAHRREGRGYDRHRDGLHSCDCRSGLVLEEIAPGLTVEDVQRATKPKLSDQPHAEDHGRLEAIMHSFKPAAELPPFPSPVGSSRYWLLRSASIFSCSSTDVRTPSQIPSTEFFPTGFRPSFSGYGSQATRVRSAIPIPHADPRSSS